MRQQQIIPSVQQRAPSQRALVIPPGGEKDRAEEPRRETLHCFVPFFSSILFTLPTSPSSPSILLLLLLFPLLWYNTLAVVAEAGCNVG